jgi:hypothetical protein
LTDFPPFSKPETLIFQGFGDGGRGGICAQNCHFLGQNYPIHWTIQV